MHIRYQEKKLKKELDTPPSAPLPSAPTPPSPIPIPKPTPKQKNMDFDTFADYMNRYENMKKSFMEQARKAQPAPAPAPTPTKKPSYHPDNYPLAHLYNPSLRNSHYSI